MVQREQVIGKNSVELFLSGVKSQDEFDTFRGVVNKMKMGNQELLHMSIGRMSSKGQKFFYEIINKLRVNSDKGNSVPRRIVKVREKATKTLN